MQNENEKSSYMDEGINGFVQRHRKPLFISAGLALLLLIVFIAVLSLMDMLNGKAISVVEEFNSRYESLAPYIAEEYSALDVEELLADLETFAKKKSGYAGGRAWSIIGNIYGKQEDWAGAEAAWTAAAGAAGKTYLAPFAWFNAGTAAEEQGKTEQAIEYYTKSLSPDFPAAPRAQFSIGRLRENQDNNAAAIEAYRAVISGWSRDLVWPSLARSRIIALETMNGSAE